MTIMNMMVYKYDSSQLPIMFDVHDPDRFDCSTHAESAEHQKQSGCTESVQLVQVVKDVHE